MAKQSINLGSTANDGGGTTLRAGGDIVNDNFSELYTALGNGTALQISLGSPSTGDVLTYNGSIFTTATPSTLANIVEDTTPQLGGNLDVNAKQIISASNNNIIIAPNGSGAIVLDGQSWPQADGSANQVLKTDGSGQISYGNVEADDIAAGNAAINLTTTAGNITIDAQGSDTDIIFKGTDGSTDITPMTLDMSAGGDLFLTGGLIDLKNDGSNVSQIKFYCEASNAHAQTLIGAPHSEGANNVLTLPGTGGDARLVSTNSTAVLTNKGISGDNNILADIANSSLTNSSVTIGSTAVALGATVTTFAGLSSVTSTNFVGDITGGITTTGTAGTTGGITATTGSSGYTADNTHPGDSSSQRSIVTKSIASGSLTKDGSTSNSFGAVSATFNSSDKTLNKGELTFRIKITPAGGSTTSFVPTFASFGVSINSNSVATDPSIVAAFTSSTLVPSGTKTAEYSIQDVLTMIDGVNDFTVTVTPSVVIAGTDDNTSYTATVDMFFTKAADRSINIDNGTMPIVDVLKATDLMKAPVVSLATKESIAAENGLVVYDSTNDKLQVYTGGNWVNLH